MIKKMIFIAVLFFAFTACTNAKHEKEVVKEKEAVEEKIIQDNRISLRSDTVNLVKMTDTMVVYESTCRGCAYEGSTNFGISDSLGIIKLDNVITKDNNSPDMDGGSISKTLVLVPAKTGITTIKVYKFWTQEKKAEDSARFTAYTIDVRN